MSFVILTNEDHSAYCNVSNNDKPELDAVYMYVEYIETQTLYVKRPIYTSTMHDD